MRVDELSAVLRTIKEVEQFFDLYPPIGDATQEYLEILHKLREQAMIRYASNALSKHYSTEIEK